MIELEVPYNRNKRVVTILNEWDVRNRLHVFDTPQNVRLYRDSKSILRLNDGSKWYAEAQGVYEKNIYGDWFNISRNAYLTVSFPFCAREIYGNVYDGNFLVKEPTAKELLRVKQFLNHEPTKVLTRREKVLVLEELKKRLKEKGVGADFVVDNIITECTNPRNKGFERLKANAMVGRILGVELEETRVQQETPRALIGNMNILTVQDQRRADLPTLPELREMIGQVPSAEIKPPEGVEFEVVDE